MAMMAKKRNCERFVCYSEIRSGVGKLDTIFFLLEMSMKVAVEEEEDRI